MERYAASVGCRHRHLVEYFGERYGRTDCGACDFCLGELEPVGEAAVLARKILSCVARVGQRFGASHVANVLCGSENEQVLSRRHNELTTFGLLRDATSAEVRGYIEQLVAAGFLRQTDDAFPVIALTAPGVELLKDASAAGDLALSRQRRVVREREQKRSRVETEAWEGVDRDLFEELRAVRLQIARARGVPPVRHLPRHDAARAGAAQAADAGGASHGLRRRRPQGGGLRGDVLERVKGDGITCDSAFALRATASAGRATCDVRTEGEWRPM